MGQRKEPRTQAKIAVKLWGTDAHGRPFIDSVHTRNVSNEGALLEGVQRGLKPGDSVGITYGQNKARFRVAWVGQAGTPHEGMLGVEAVTKGKCIWDIPLEAARPDPFVHGGGRDRRQFPRFECTASVEISAENSVAPLRGKLADLSLGGCYAEMMIPLKVGAKLNLAIWLDAVKITTAGMVTSSHPGFGIGIKFIGMAGADRERLQEYLKKQAASSIPQKRLAVDRSHAARAGVGDTKTLSRS
jgi:hypothetical protein